MGPKRVSAELKAASGDVLLWNLSIHSTVDVFQSDLSICPSFQWDCGCAHNSISVRFVTDCAATSVFVRSFGSDKIGAEGVIVVFCGLFPKNESGGGEVGGGGLQNYGSRVPHYNEP